MTKTQKQTTLMIVSAVLNILCYVMGTIPNPSNPAPTFSMILLCATPLITCVAAGILAGSKDGAGFRQILIPVAMNAAVWILGAGVSGGLFAAVLVNVILGVIPGAVAMAVTRHFAGKSES